MHEMQAQGKQPLFLIPAHIFGVLWLQNWEVPACDIKACTAPMHGLHEAAASTRSQMHEMQMQGKQPVFLMARTHIWRVVAAKLGGTRLGYQGLHSTHAWAT